MYRKYLMKYKMYPNDRWNSIVICIEWESINEIQDKKDSYLKNISKLPIVAENFNWDPLYWFWKIPYSVSIS